MPENLFTNPINKELLTINTNPGLFRFLRLPFGVKSMPAIFQLTVDSKLTGLRGFVAYIDNIIVMGSNPEELQHLNEVLDRI